MISRPIWGGLAVIVVVVGCRAMPNDQPDAVPAPPEQAAEPEFHIEVGSWMSSGPRAVAVRVPREDITNNPAIQPNLHVSVFCLTKNANGEIERKLVIEDALVLATEERCRNREGETSFIWLSLRAKQMLDVRLAGEVGTLTVELRPVVQVKL
jgi:Flp pilus assembly protein CpaB